MLSLAKLREAEKGGCWPNGHLFRSLELRVGEGEPLNLRKFSVWKFTEVVPDKVFLFETNEGNFLIAVDNPLWHLILWAKQSTTIYGDASEQYIPRMFAKCR